MGQTGIRITAGDCGTGDVFVRLQVPGRKYAIVLAKHKCASWSAAMVAPFGGELAGDITMQTGAIYDAVTHRGMRRFHDLLNFIGEDRLACVRDPEAMALGVLGPIFTGWLAGKPRNVVRLRRRAA